MAFYMLMCC